MRNKIYLPDKLSPQQHPYMVLLFFVHSLQKSFKSALKWMKHLKKHKKTWQNLHMSKKSCNFATLL